MKDYLLVSATTLRKPGIMDSQSQKKRKVSPVLVPNPLIKKRNLEWRISPPPLRNPERRRPRSGHKDGRDARLVEEREDEHAGDHEVAKLHKIEEDQSSSEPEPRVNSPPGTAASKPGPSTSALIESAQTKITDHLKYFASLLASSVLHPFPASQSRLPVSSYADLYAQSLHNSQGAHFVVTQHDHPVAGPHYDLRLQANGASSCSWAIMYGMPGDPNARGRSGAVGGGCLRNATETRVHCLWNHLVETAERETGSLLIWDTGEYEILRPREAGRGRRSESTDDEEEEGRDGVGGGGSDWDGLTQQQKLARSFGARKIRLQLHGARLPRTYVVNLRLTRNEDAAGRAKAARAAMKKRKGETPRRRLPLRKQKSRKNGPDTSSSGEDAEGAEDGGEEEGEEATKEGHGGPRGKDGAAAGLSEMERELRELEDEEVRRTNAYTGAVNDIGSVHQRKWFLSLDREACGFEKMRRDGRAWWERRREEGGEEGEEEGEGEEGGERLEWPFYVRGPEHERSVVTGRLGADILRDEGVVGYVGRKGWRPILH